MEFLKVCDRAYPENTEFTSPKQIVEFMADISEIDRETLWIIHLNSRLHIIDREMVSMGTVSGTLAHPREIFRKAIIKQSCGIILVHNHPSGDPSPSPEDHSITEKVQSAAKILGIDFLDHIIIARDGKSFSYSDQDLI